MSNPLKTLFLAPLLLAAALATPTTAQLTPPDELFGQEAVVHPEYTLADLEALVAEFETVVPRFELYTYPIRVTIEENDEVNAGAGISIEGEDGQVLQAILQVNTGFLEAVGNDPRLIRAVVAHEMAHLALGHAAEWADTSDLEQLLTRQEELAADAAGASYLEALGHPVQDMVDLLLFLDTELPKAAPIWLAVTLSDHASPVTRAALISRDDRVLSALAHMETGLAFMECRRYEEAIAWFEAALALEPRMQEAQVNIGIASVQDYYERLPIAVRDTWLHPEFTPHLTFTSLLGGRSLAVTDEDFERFQLALERIEAIPDGLYGRTKGFLRGTARVLTPRDDQTVIQEGIRLLEEQLLLFPSVMPLDVQVGHLRLANNMAVGLHRLGRTTEAQARLVGESLRVSEAFLTYAAENMGRLPCAALDKDEARRALDFALRYVESTPPESSQFAVVRATLDNLLDTLGLALVSEPETAPVYLCKAVSMTIDGHEFELFGPLGEAFERLGDPGLAGFLLEKYPDLACVLWGDNDVVLLTERERIMKLTSYRPGTTIDLRPQNRSIREVHQVRVGMTVAELEAVIDPGGDGAFEQLTQLFGRSAFSEDAGLELWTYYPTLNLGVLIEDGVVVGLSVTPIKG